MSVEQSGYPPYVSYFPVSACTIPPYSFQLANQQDCGLIFDACTAQQPPEYFSPGCVSFAKFFNVAATSIEPTNFILCFDGRHLLNELFGLQN